MGAATLPNVAGSFSSLTSSSSLAAQSNLAFLGMWITSNRSDQASFLPFDADARSSSNMASSQPGRRARVQSWSGGRLGALTQEGFWNWFYSVETDRYLASRLGANFYGVREKRGGRVVDLRIKNMVRVSLALS